MKKPETQLESLLYVVAFVFLSGGVFMFSIFGNQELDIPDGMTVMLMLLGPSVIAWLFYRRIGGLGWLVTAVLGGCLSMFILTIYLAAEEIIHPALLFAMYAFTAAGAVLYFVNRRKLAAERAPQQPVEWEKLGTREKSPAERDVPRAA